MTENFLLEVISDNPYQPRTVDNAEHIENLARSIAADGLLQTPKARLVAGNIQLAFGHSRRKAFEWLRENFEKAGLPSQIYDQLLQSLEKGELNKLERQIFLLLKEHPAGLSRQDLVLKIQGYWPEKLDGNTDDRKNRKAIRRLRERLVPIVSTSGQPGYRLDISREGVDRMLAELRCKKDLLEQQIESTLKFYSIPIEYLTDPKEVKQLEAF